MRFDKRVDLYSLIIVEDSIGGREEQLTFIKSVYANVNTLTFEETVKIYGEAMTGILKVTIQGFINVNIDRIKYNKKTYKVKKNSQIKNKTSYLLEVIEDEH